MKKSKLSLALLVLTAVMVTPSMFADPGFPPSVPDASSSALLLSIGFAGVAMVKKLIR